MQAAIECAGLSKTYKVGFLARKVKALLPIDFQVNPGEVFGLIGPNGAGKSTAIKLLLNLVMPTTGKALLFGVDATDPRSRVSVGYVPEAPVPYEHLSGVEYLSLQAGLAGLKGAAAKTEVVRVLERVDMTRHGKLRIRQYSKGMTQRVMLAGALVGKPRIVILDEPTSGLDPLGRRLVRDLILELRRDGAAVLFCTHIMSDVEMLCDRVALLIGGTIHKSGRISDLVADTRTHEVVVDNASREQVLAVVKQDDALRLEVVAQRVLMHVADNRLQDVLRALLNANLTVSRIQPERIPLEETFMAALRSSTPVAGASGDIE
jgi:ABC-2 type transport system ATP-binding protein